MQKLLWTGVLFVNFATFLVFTFDKYRSKRQGARRIAERSLLGLMFVGGLAGGWAAMQLFRHKTLKRSFRMKAILCTLFSPVWLLIWWSWTTAAAASD